MGDPNDPTLVLVDEAFKIAKKMSTKLRQYKYNYDNDWYEKNRDIEETLSRRKGRNK